MGRFRNYARVEEFDLEHDGRHVFVRATSGGTIISVDVQDWESDEGLVNAIDKAKAEYFATADYE